MLRFIVILFLLSLAATAVGQANVYPLDDAYTRPWELADRLREIAALKPDIVHIDTLGHSGTRGLPITALRISDNADRDEPDEPAILFCGPHQGEEVLGLEIVLHNARSLVEAYGADEEITRMVDESEIWFVPVVCVEGWRWTAAGVYPLKRKNDADSNGNGLFDLRIDGVDLNKNYPVTWAEDTHNNPASDYYKGPWPASETEVAAMMAFYERERPATAVFYHSSATGAYSELIFFPWRLGDDVSPAWPELRDRALRLARTLPRDYAPGRYHVFVGQNNARGYARHYVYATHRTYAFTIEVGGNCAVDGGDVCGVIHPGGEQLAVILRKHWDACLEALRMFPEDLVEITVLDPRGEPLRGVEAHLPDWDDYPLLAPTRTDEHGRVWRYLPPGRWPVVIDGQSFWLNASQRASVFRIAPSDRTLLRERL